MGSLNLQASYSTTTTAYLWSYVKYLGTDFHWNHIITCKSKLEAFVWDNSTDSNLDSKEFLLVDVHNPHACSLYDRLYFSSYASHKQPVKENEVVVSDWLPMSRCGMRKFHTGHLPAMKPIMYPKILKHRLPALRLECMVLSRFVMYYRVFIRRLYANGYVSFRPKFWSTGS